MADGLAQVGNYLAQMVVQQVIALNHDFRIQIDFSQYSIFEVALRPHSQNHFLQQGSFLGAKVDGFLGLVANNKKEVVRVALQIKTQFLYQIQIAVDGSIGAFEDSGQKLD